MEAFAQGLRHTDDRDEDGEDAFITLYLDPLVNTGDKRVHYLRAVDNDPNKSSKLDVESTENRNAFVALRHLATHQTRGMGEVCHTVATSTTTEQSLRAICHQNSG